MKKYVIVDQRENDEFEEYFETEKEAIEQAEYEWDHLTESEKKKCLMFAVLYGEYDDVEGFDFYSSIEIKSFINRSRNQL